MSSGPKLLVVDIETAPNKAFTWGLWQQNVGAMDQLIEPGRMLCFGARWHGKKKVLFKSEYHHSRLEMLETIHGLLNEADFVVGWNSQRFDRRWINAELDKEGFDRPAPAKDIDLMKVVRKNLYLPSYKLDYVAQRHYGLPGKVTHEGFKLWRAIEIGTDEERAKAWRTMKRYQIGDIKVTDSVLERVKPWITTLPNPALYDDEGNPRACGCGSTRLQRRGYAYTSVSRYPRFQCQGCGSWLRGGKRDHGVDVRRVA